MMQMGLKNKVEVSVVGMRTHGVSNPLVIQEQ